MGKAHDEQYFLEQFALREDRDEYIYQNDYKGWNEYIILIHKPCGKQYKVKPISFINQKTRCPYCVRTNNGKKRRTDEQIFLIEFNKQCSEFYEFTDDYEYKGIKTPISVKCKNCGKIKKITPAALIYKGVKCRCYYGRLEINEEQAKQKIHDKFPDLELIGEYNGWRYINTFKCHKCGNVFTATCAELMTRKYGCGNCYHISQLGVGNYFWKGGDSEIKQTLRGISQTWKFESANLYNTRCILTNKSDNNEVHHLYKNFMDIVHETFEKIELPLLEKISDYTQEEYLLIIKTFKQIENSYGPGVVINKDLHRQFHYRYGFNNNTPEQFIEFAKTYGVDLIIDENGIVKNIINKK